MIMSSFLIQSSINAYHLRILPNLHSTNYPPKKKKHTRSTNSKGTGRNNYYYVLLAFYLLLIIFIDIYFKQGLNPHDIATVATSTRKEIQSRNAEPQQHIEEPQLEYYEDDYSYIEAELEELTLDDINEMLGETPVEESPEMDAPAPEGDSDLIDEILKEIELDKK